MQMRSKNAGFTAVELIVVVAVIAVGGIIAITVFTDKKEAANKNEAVIQLRKIGLAATDAYRRDGAFPRGSAPLTPATNCCAQNVSNDHTCAVVDSDWSAPEWRALHFAPHKAFLYQYSYTGSPDGTEFTATAVGNLNCDATTVTYTLVGDVVDGTARVRLIEPKPHSD